MLSLAFISLIGLANSKAVEIYSFPFNTLPANSGVGSLYYAYSYSSQQTANPSYVDPKHFSIDSPPDGSSPQVLKAQLYDTDTYYSTQYVNTCPKVMVYPNPVNKALNPTILLNTPYVMQWQQYTYQYYIGNNFQIMNAGNVAIKWVNGAYWIFANIVGSATSIKLTGLGPTVPKTNPKISADMHEDMYRWVNFRVEFQLSNTNGFVNFYRDNNLLGSCSGSVCPTLEASYGTSATNSSSYPQIGYNIEPVNSVCNPTNAIVYYKNYEFWEGLGSQVAFQPILPYFPLQTGFTTVAPKVTTTASAAIPCQKAGDCPAFQQCISNFCAPIPTQSPSAYAVTSPAGKVLDTGTIVGIVIGIIAFSAVMGSVLYSIRAGRIDAQDAARIEATRKKKLETKASNPAAGGPKKIIEGTPRLRKMEGGSNSAAPKTAEI